MLKNKQTKREKTHKKHDQQKQQKKRKKERKEDLMSELLYSEISRYFCIAYFMLFSQHSLLKWSNVALGF